MGDCGSTTLKLRKLFLALVAAIGVSSLSSGQVFAQSGDLDVAPAAIQSQRWTRGWDLFGEPLNFATSKVTWSLSSSRYLTINYILRGAKRSKLYQVGIALFCSVDPRFFGQFPTAFGCTSYTRQGVTAKETPVSFGVVTTDAYGNGSFSVVVGPIRPGTYRVEFYALNGAGCGLEGGLGGYAGCFPVFQSPGPIYGRGVTTIVVP